MAKVCDNTSVAMLVRKNGEILLIERKKYNPGFALPAGHQDGLRSTETARKELAEEVGLVADQLKKRLVKRLDNPCTREGGNYHTWTVFEVPEWHGEIKASEDEAKQAIWVDGAAVQSLAHKLEQFMRTHHLTLDNLPALVKATNERKEWWDSPGLEPPMYILFKELGIL